MPCGRWVPMGAGRAPRAAGRLLQGLNEDCQAIQLAIGDKVGLVIFNLTTAFVGIILGEPQQSCQRCRAARAARAAS